MAQRKTWLSLFFQALLLLAFSAVIVLFMPRAETFSYDYELDKPWRYGDIIASHNFPIYKSDQVVSHERDSVMRLYHPYYTFSDTAATQVARFWASFRDGQQGALSWKYANYVAKRLEDIYAAGIMDSGEYTQWQDSAVTGIALVEGNTARVIALRDIYTVRSAYADITAGDSVHFLHDILMQCPLEDFLTPNLAKDNERSEQSKHDLNASVIVTKGEVALGQKVIGRGDIVTEERLAILESMKRDVLKANGNRDEQRLLLAGQWVFVLLLLLTFYFYLKLFRPDYLHSDSSLLLLFFLISVFPIITSLIEHRTGYTAYIIPYAMVPLFVRVFLDARTAFVAHVVCVLLSAMSVYAPFEFVVVQIVAGFAAIYSVKEITSRSDVFRSAVIVTGLAALTMLTYDISLGTTFAKLSRTWYMALVMSGVLLLFAYPLMYLFEKLFGFTSSVTLIELSNINAPLLRRMSKEAQGTFNHSMQVANLATEVAAKIGAKTELVRTGALYHDIGKMKNPAFYTENQSSVNPHDNLSEERSAQIIIQHVADGLEMADKNRLPADIKGFIATHHGRSKTKYFYVNYVNKHPGEPVNEELFTYPGPNPNTLEQAILMMADSVEAASRSLKIINDDTLRELVGRIIDTQVSEGYFRDCPITFHDIEVAKEQFISSLKTIYHTRISYPEIKKPEQPATNQQGNFFGSYKNWNHTRRDRRQQRQNKA
jgi:putative nucleotidyltransferase with HDIG domain